VDLGGDGGDDMTPAARVCGSCGTELAANAKFCSQCGASITTATTPAEYKQVTVLFADTAEIVTYAYDQIEQARAELNAVSK
jgi:uncharacterized membrane protein YvbJ